MSIQGGRQKDSNAKRKWVYLIGTGLATLLSGWNKTSGVENEKSEHSRRDWHAIEYVEKGLVTVDCSIPSA